MRTRKRFGQHFLEAAWADKVVAAIAPQPSDRFVEIGPGPGALTFRLAPRVAHLTAIEVDRDLAADLRPQLPANVDLVVGDVLEVDLAAQARGAFRVAGNLPYNISTPILFRLIALARAAPPWLPASAGRLPPAPELPPDRLRQGYGESRRSALPAKAEGGSHGGSPPILDATLMVQREVADRLEAAPGSRDYGVLSISVQLYADVKRVLTLPPGAFRPPPKVHSAVVRLAFRPPPVAVGDERVFEAMVRSMFTQRRKTLANALAGFAGQHGQHAADALRAAGIDPSRRPETLALDELARLAARFQTCRSG
jgi:16S rRNA (adenine1518-N6/adenine1519-N6)-dimethyltransferase